MVTVRRGHFELIFYLHIPSSKQDTNCNKYEELAKNEKHIKVTVQQPWCNCFPVSLWGRQLKVAAGNAIFLSVALLGELFRILETSNFLMIEPVPKLSFVRQPFCLTFNIHLRTHTHMRARAHTSASEC